MRVLVNALSVTNQSGRHVLLGHLNQLSRLSAGDHEFVVLYHSTNQDIVSQRDAFHWIECPDSTARWHGRALWEYRNLNRMSRRHQCDLIFTPAGVSVPGIETPQVVFCQNPWCLVPGLHQSTQDKVKAAIQRRAYRRTMRDATLMVLNSNYMMQAYRDNANDDTANSIVVYQGIADETWEAADRLGKSMMERNHIVSVSAMAPHKGADTLVRAVRLVRDRGVDAKLTLAGGWPDRSYRTSVEQLVRDLKLDDHVHFSGWISDQQLLELYSRAHVFCLLSRCESFGIPAVEAQSFGTPALGTTACAIPEIGGDGGLYSAVDDARAAAENLVCTLSDDAVWRDLSVKAVHNANRFRWETCSQPLMQMFDVASAK
ncbi:MAG: glycosyltransferase [Planctomycetales bacterium]|nr:glycosyltransferase [Planctomycetales bacterium]